jgi:hypothetical protein
MADQPSNSKGLMGWLGRQVGHVRKAIKTPITPEPLYRTQQVEEAAMPGKPGLKLRRTTIDEVISDHPNDHLNQADQK